MKRVLIVAFDFPPQGGTSTIRVAKFVKYLPQFGWQPLVVSSDTIMNPDPTLLPDIPADVPVRRVGWPRIIRAFRPAVPTPVMATGPVRLINKRPNRRGALKAIRSWLVPDPTVLWVGAARQACVNLLRETPCDVILTSGPPNSVHLVGQWLHAHRRVCWVADFRDTWTIANPELRQLGALIFALQRRTERNLLKDCDKAILVSEGLTEATVESFGENLRPKLVTITNGFDPADFAGPQPGVASSGRFVISYLGTVVGRWTNNAFPEGLRLALETSDTFRETILVRFVGQLDLDYRARLAGMEANVQFTDFVPHATAIGIMRQSHLLLLTLVDSELSRMTYTNKFFEYLAARRPILAVVPSGLISKIIIEGQVGLVAAPNDPRAIAQALLKMFDTIRAQPHNYTAPDELLARFDRRRLTETLVGVLDGVSR